MNMEQEFETYYQSLNPTVNSFLLRSDKDALYEFFLAGIAIGRMDALMEVQEMEKNP
jgi:hypothetical protein